MCQDDLTEMITLALEGSETINVYAVLREAARELEYLARVETYAKSLCGFVLANIPIPKATKERAEELAMFLRPRV